jgi:hypothetical protein
MCQDGNCRQSYAGKRSPGRISVGQKTNKPPLTPGHSRSLSGLAIAYDQTVPLSPRWRLALPSQLPDDILWDGLVPTLVLLKQTVKRWLNVDHFDTGVVVSK